LLQSFDVEDRDVSAALIGQAIKENHTTATTTVLGMENVQTILPRAAGVLSRSSSNDLLLIVSFFTMSLSQPRSHAETCRSLTSHFSPSLGQSTRRKSHPALNANYLLIQKHVLCRMRSCVDMWGYDDPDVSIAQARMAGVT
jgi:hypothetical protein